MSHHAVVQADDDGATGLLEQKRRHGVNDAHQGGQPQVAGEEQGASGMLRKRAALLDAEALNVGVTVFVRQRTQSHDAEGLESFARAVAEIEEVVEFYRLSGNIDYLPKIVVSDIAGYDAVYKRLIACASFSDVAANFTMETIKTTAALPLSHALEDR